MAADKRQHKVGLKARESGGKQDVKSFHQKLNKIFPTKFLRLALCSVWARALSWVGVTVNVWMYI